MACSGARYASYGSASLRLQSRAALYYKITDTTNHEVAVVNGNNELTGAIAIPATVMNGSNTYSVTSIGKYAFYWCMELTSINIPNSVTSIGYGAFYNCINLTAINIPSSITSIGKYAFSGCSGLTSINIPYSVTSIGYGAFSGCSRLTSIVIPTSCEASIATGALAGCSGLTSITIPSSVTSIDSAAFYGCSGLTSINIPGSVTSIGEYAFYGCSGLTSINIPNGIKKLEYGTFSGCTSLNSITIPEGLDSFTNKLKYFGLYGEYSEYPPGAFAGCSSLTSINIPSSVKFIGQNTFAYSGLISINIPNSVTIIENGAFSGCTNLTSINILNGATSIGSNNFCSNPYTYSQDKGVFEGCTSLTSINIPNSVTSIGQRAFWGCSGLTSINIPNSVTSIGQRAFSDCSGLTSINIPNGVTSIGESTFFRCSGLTSINIPNSVTSIGESAFYGCSGLTSINIPNSVTSIGDGAFSECSGLTSITIPNSVTSIRKRAFAGCSGLTSITIPNSVTSIGDGAFSECSGLTSINIPNGVTKIDNGAFYNCTRLTSVNLPSGLDSIGSNNYYFSHGAFEGCTSLTSITIPNSVRYIGKNAFKDCTGLTSINIPSGITKIEYQTFSGCRGLTSINIPNSVTSIGERAFYDCSGLTSINIPNSVTSIGDYAFTDCSGLTSINIPSSVTSIGDRTFYGCSGLTAVAVGWQTPLVIDLDVFDGVPLNRVKLIVPAGKKSVYQSEFVWSFFNLIEEAVIITYYQPIGGSLRIFNAQQEISSGSELPDSTILTVEVTPNQHYKFKCIYVNGTCITGFSFMLKGNTTITALFSKEKHTVTYTQPANGTLTVKNGSQTIHSGDSVEYGTVLTIEATPAQYYKRDSIRVNGIRTSGFSFTVDSNTMVEAYFSKMKYMVTYTQPANGTLTVKNGLQTIHSGDSVEYGSMLTVEATPAQDYRLDSLRINGELIVGLSFMVQGNTTVEVIFGRDEYNVIYNQSEGGTFRILSDLQEIIVSGDMVDKGKTLTIEVTPAQHYKFDSIKVNNIRLEGFSFIVEENSTVEVYFSKMKYTVTYTQPANGMFMVEDGWSPVSSGSSMEYGKVLTVNATPSHGYKLDSVRVNGTRISGLSFTVNDNITVEVFFGKKKHLVIYTQPIGGTFKVKNGSQEVASGSSVEYGTVLTFEATAAEHYKFDSIRVNGTRISGLSFTVTDNTNIEVFFGKQSYTVTYNSNMYSGKIEVTRGSEIVASGSSVEYGTQLMVRAIPNHGFEVKSLTINDQAIVNNFVFSISEPIEIKAVFAPATTALDEAATKPLAIYPNPVAEVLYLSATARTIRIYDMYGTEVAHATDTDKVEVSHLPAGVYTVRADGSIAKMVKR